ncbi:hypothetical protein JXA56_00455 [Candidatus Micrarchaeota archaeon]|nr:hypothetical protein [Candidatus Micrarchaeota archaeon]
MPVTKKKEMEVPVFLVVGLQARYPEMSGAVAQDLLRAAQTRANGGVIKLSPETTPYREQFDAIVSVLQGNKVSDMSKLSQARLSALSTEMDRTLSLQTRAPSLAKRGKGVHDFVPTTVPKKTRQEEKRTEHAFNYSVTIGKQTFAVQTETSLRGPKRENAPQPMLSIVQLQERIRSNPESIVITDSEGKKVSPDKIYSMIEIQNQKAFREGADPPKIKAI